MNRRTFLQLTGLSTIAALLPLTVKSLGNCQAESVTYYTVAARTLEPGTYRVTFSSNIEADKTKYLFRDIYNQTVINMGPTYVGPLYLYEDMHVVVQDKSIYELVMVAENFKRAGFDEISIVKVL